jgi:hypothetical protein
VPDFVNICYHPSIPDWGKRPGSKCSACPPGAWLVPPTRAGKRHRPAVGTWSWRLDLHSNASKRRRRSERAVPNALAENAHVIEAGVDVAPFGAGDNLCLRVPWAFAHGYILSPFCGCLGGHGTLARILWAGRVALLLDQGRAGSQFALLEGPAVAREHGNGPICSTGPQRQSWSKPAVRCQTRWQKESVACGAGLLG